MKALKLPPASKQAGFTIIELMIATSILSVILVMATIMLTGIGDLYYKGVNQTRIQKNVRSITDDISQRLQLSSRYSYSTASSSSYVGDSICIGTTRYSYVINKKIGTDTAANESKHVLWRDTLLSGSTCSVPDLNTDLAVSTTSGSELIAPNSRLTVFSVSNNNGVYSIAIGVAYGDTDLLNINGKDTNCSGGSGKQFCAVSYLETSVQARLE